MRPAHGVHRGFLQDALLDHRRRPGNRLLRGLEHKLDATPGQAYISKHERGADQPRSVEVVPAGMCHAGACRAPGEPSVLLQGQSIHIRPEQEAGPSLAQRGDDTMPTHAGAHVQARLSQPLGHHTGGPLLGATQLWVLVQIPAQGDDLIEVPCRRPLQ